MLPIKGKRFFHPFKLLRKYLVLCGGYKCKNEEFFIFRDRSAVTPANAHNVLKTAISKIGLNPAVYDFHSYRIGRASELIKLGYTVEQVKRFGRWRSNAVYKYIKC